MSIASEISRLQQAKADLKTIIESKGVTVPSGTTLDEYPALVQQIIDSGIDWETIAKGMLDYTTTFEIPNNVYFNAKETNIFYGRKNLIGSVTIPASTTYINTGAFRGCTNVTSVIIPNSVTRIFDWAFGGAGLTSIQIPNSVTRIDGYAFHSCPLSSITIPSSVTTLGSYIFNQCSQIETMIVETGNTAFDSRNNCNAIIGTANNELWFGCKNTIIPNSVTSIRGSAFYESYGLTALTIPSSVTTIGGSAFINCSNLTELIFEGTTPPTLSGSSALGQTNYSFPIYVPDGAVNDYKVATNWVSYASRIKGISERNVA